MIFLPAPLPFLSPHFASHMVLQRDKPNTFWGWTTPGETVSVTVEGRRASGKAGKDGQWTVRFMPPKVGGPYTVTIEGESPDMDKPNSPTKIGTAVHAVALTDVLVGDVWLCGGQSNMEFGLTQANGGEEVAKADRPRIRLFMAPRQTGYAPKPLNGGTWKVCTPATVDQDGWGGFSAVGYFFGKRLQDELNVPIGLVEDCWGGTSAEAWTSERGLRPLNDFNEPLDRVALANTPLQRRESNDPEFGTYTDLWLAERDLHRGDFSTVQAAELPGYEGFDEPTGDWDRATLPGTLGGEARGVVWARRTLDFPAEAAGKPATLTLGRIAETDTTYLNGTLLGTTSFDWANRQYAIPANVLRPGRNELAVRVFNPRVEAAFLSKPEDLALTLVDGTRLPLAGEWKTKVAFDLRKTNDRPRDLEPNPTVPSVLYNGMIAPLAPLAIKGAIWYQGETNSGRGAQYRRLLPALIADWRRAFGQGDFPFYIVQLANFMPRDPKPGDDYWAELRDAQAHAAQTVKNSGLAVTIDVGLADDVHPRDKRTVGERLARLALAKTYGKPLEFSGPTYRSMKVEGNAIRLTFDHARNLRAGQPGVEYRRQPDPVGFAVAGADRQWRWAEARIEGNAIVVRSPEVPNPVAVRYAWGHNPDVNLYNGDWLPTVPFRTDDWPLLSRDAR